MANELESAEQNARITSFQSEGNRELSEIQHNSCNYDHEKEKIEVTHDSDGDDGGGEDNGVGDTDSDDDDDHHGGFSDFSEDEYVEAYGFGLGDGDGDSDGDNHQDRSFEELVENEKIDQDGSRFVHVEGEENKDVEQDGSGFIHVEGVDDEDEERDVSGFVHVEGEERRSDSIFNDNKEKNGWETARAWLWTLPRRWNVSFEEVEEWVKGNKEKLSREIVTMPRTHLFRFLVAQHKLMRRAEHMKDVEVLEPPTARFKRSDKWKPVYSWLESLNMGSVVGARAIEVWLETNPTLRAELLGKHTRHHLFHYIQKCHTNIIKKKKKQVLNGVVLRLKKKKERKRPPRKFLKEGSNTVVAACSKTINGKAKVGDCTSTMASGVMQLQRENSIKVSYSLETAKLRTEPTLDKAQARRKYDILSELQEQLLVQITQIKEQMRMVSFDISDRPSSSAHQSADNSNQAGPSGVAFDSQNLSYEGPETSLRRFRDIMQSGDIKSPKKRKKLKDKFHNRVLSWAFTEIDAGSSNLSTWESNTCLEKIGPLNGSSSASSLNRMDESRISKMIGSQVKFLQERERGAGIGYRVVPFCTLKRGQRHRWKSLMEGWYSLEKQFTGCGVYLQRKAFSTWQPCWSAYTSSVAVAAPLGMVDQGVQKVLDVRFHPKNLPQLVCSSNAAPNELLLYDLLTGKPTKLIGHDCQIQAIEFAVDGERIVSCGSNLVKIWDSVGGACLHTLGPGSWDENASGHRKKINAMAVNGWQSYVVATSGGQGDNQVLLWNVSSGEMSCDLNRELRNQTVGLPCMDALEFCNQNLLICGSDSLGGAAIVQIWDIQAPEIVASFPANDSYITSLKTDPNGMTIATGAGDGSVGLFDVRSCGAITRLPVGSNSEVTSVSFSSCGIFLQASSTANTTIVWDTRMLSMKPGLKPVDAPIRLADNDSRKIRALHCLCHGVPMPTSQNAGQMPGFVDVGDQGVNDARWFHNDSILVTASGNGSIAIWDVSLGDPCIRHMTSHTRCVNTVVISPNDTYICSGGDDQKVVLYENIKDISRNHWRLTHPLLEETSID